MPKDDRDATAYHPRPGARRRGAAREEAPGLAALDGNHSRGYR
jgi:hypothetical protein